MCRGCASLIRPFRSSQRLWSTVSKAVPYTVMPKMLYTKTVQSLLQPLSLVYMWSARLYPTQSCQRYYTPRQCSPSYSQRLWSTVSKAVPYTVMSKILYIKTVQSVLQPPGLQSARPYPRQPHQTYYTLTVQSVLQPPGLQSARPYPTQSF